MSRPYDAAVIGSGPNGLAAALLLAGAGLRVVVYEAHDTPGGGVRSAELTEPGFVHDVCSAFHPMAVASPFLRGLPLRQHGLDWVDPPAACAHPLEGGKAAVQYRSLAETVRGLGRDGPGWDRLMRPFVERWRALFVDAMGPLSIPDAPVLMGRFGLAAMRPASWVCRFGFREAPAAALFAGIAGHSVLPLERTPSAAIAMMLGIAGHAVGWPFPRGGAQRLTDAMVGLLLARGGLVQTGVRIEALEQVETDGPVLFDVGPKQVAGIAGKGLPERFRARLQRYRYGPASFKVDFALSEPIPWENREVAQAGTVHLGGTWQEIAEAERAPWNGKTHPRPYILVGQQSLFDDTRAPAGKHTGWAYCHVPNGSDADMTGAIEDQIERFAPGFKDTILARHVTTPADFSSYNPSYVGGDVVGGIADLWQLFSRPVARAQPHTTPNPRLYMCSASTPPGGGVHGMGGYHAARLALSRRR